MKTIALFLCILFSSLSFAAPTCSGFITKANGDTFLTPANSKTLYRIIPRSPDVEASLAQLNTGDWISGDGLFGKSEKMMELQNINFVGLRGLLGPWLTEGSTLVFQDFNNMLYKTLAGQSIRYHYSVSPGENGEWAIFLSDDSHTILGSLILNSNLANPPSKPPQNKSALMKIFEAATGRIVRTLKLERP